MVDAPVSGGIGAAAAGTLTFMVGGSAENYAEAEQWLKPMAKLMLHCGENGTGLVSFLTRPPYPVVVLVLVSVLAVSAIPHPWLRWGAMCACISAGGKDLQQYGVGDLYGSCQ